MLAKLIIFLAADKIDLSSETDELKDYRFVKWLCKNRKLQGIPPSAFFSAPNKHIGSDYIRLCFIKVRGKPVSKRKLFDDSTLVFQNDDSLKKAEDILKKWRAELN